MADHGFPRPRHSYTYVPRPMPGQRGALVYNGPLNQTGAMQPRPMGMGMGVGMPMGMGYGGMGMMGAGGYGVGHGSLSYYPHNQYSYAEYGNPYYGYNRGGGYHMHGHNSYGWYANPFCFLQSPYMYGAGAIGPAYGCGVGPVTYAVPAGQVQYTYVRAATTPKVLPREYTTRNYASRFIREDVETENRRVATERGAYRPRRIKPADARPDDLFWCRERDGQWTLRKYYQIEDNCHPGTWKMDAEIGFLVFHRD